MRQPRILVLDDTDDLATQLDRVTSSLRPRPEVVGSDGFEAAQELITATGPFDMVVGGPLVSRGSGFAQLSQLRSQSPGMTLVLAIDRWRNASLRDTIRTGALDILRLPATDDILRDTIQQALQVAPASAHTSAKGALAADKSGTVIAVVSATGGCGKTFFATNLAYHLQSRLDKRTCLIDLDLQFGELATALRLKPRYTISDLIAQSAPSDGHASANGASPGDGDDLARRFEEYLERHESGVYLLAGPEDPADADGIDAAHVSRVIDAARSRFDYVIIDTPAALSEAVLVALEQADQIFALATLDLPSVRNLGVMLATLKKLKVPTERVNLLLNKVEPDMGIDPARVERYFPQGFAMTIPYGREVNRSLNMGQPVLAYAPHGEVAKALGAGLSTGVIAGTDPGSAPVEVARPRRRFGGHFRKSA